MEKLYSTIQSSNEINVSAMIISEKTGFYQKAPIFKSEYFGRYKKKVFYFM